MATPQQPQKPTLVQALHDSLVVQWPTVEGATVYRVQWAAQARMYYSWLGPLYSSDPKATISGLPEATGFVVRVAAGTATPGPDVGGAAAGGQQYGPDSAVSEVFTTLTMVEDHSRLVQELEVARKLLDTLTESRTDLPIAYVERIRVAEVRALTDKLAKMTEQVAAMETQLTVALPGTQAALVESAAKLVQLQEELQRETAQLVEMRTLRAESQGYVDEAEAARRAAQAATQEATERIAWWDSEAKMAGQSEEVVVARLTAELEVATTQQAECRLQRAEVEAEITRCQARVELLMAQLNAAQAMYAEQQAEVRAQIRRAVEDAATTEEQLRVCRAELEGLAAQRDAVALEDQQVQENIAGLQAQVAAVVQAIAGAREELKEAEDRLAALTVLKIQRDELQQNIIVGTARYTSIETENTAARLVLSGLAVDVEGLRHAVTSQQQQNLESQQASDTVAATARVQLVDVQAKRDAALVEVVNLQEMVASQQLSTTSECRSLRTRLEAAQQALTHSAQLRAEEMRGWAEANQGLMDEISALRAAHRQAMADEVQQREILVQEMRTSDRTAESRHEAAAMVWQDVERRKQELQEMRSHLRILETTQEQQLQGLQRQQRFLTELRTENEQSAARVTTLRAKYQRVAAEVRAERSERLERAFEALGYNAEMALSMAAQACLWMDAGYEEAKTIQAVAAHPGDEGRQLDTLHL